MYAAVVIPCTDTFIPYGAILANCVCFLCPAEAYATPVWGHRVVFMSEMCCVCSSGSCSNIRPALPYLMWPPYPRFNRFVYNPCPGLCGRNSPYKPTAATCHVSCRARHFVFCRVVSYRVVSRRAGAARCDVGILHQRNLERVVFSLSSAVFGKHLRPDLGARLLRRVRPHALPPQGELSRRGSTFVLFFYFALYVALARPTPAMQCCVARFAIQALASVRLRCIHLACQRARHEALGTPLRIVWNIDHKTRATTVVLVGLIRISFRYWLHPFCELKTPLRTPVSCENVRFVTAQEFWIWFQTVGKARSPTRYKNLPGVWHAANNTGTPRQ